MRFVRSGIRYSCAFDPGNLFSRVRVLFFVTSKLNYWGNYSGFDSNSY